MSQCALLMNGIDRHLANGAKFSRYVMAGKSEIIKNICDAFADGDLSGASRIARDEIPFEPIVPQERSCTDAQAVKLFVRDGFIDRYSGERLVFPGVLRLISILLPAEFPYHPNWKMTDCHGLYWELSPTVDHVVPVSRGGADEQSNWVCTSMLRNAAKANWTLQELGWEVLPPGDYGEWDGMLGWFMRHIQSNETLLAENSLRKWHGAAGKALGF